MISNQNPSSSINNFSKIYNYKDYENSNDPNKEGEYLSRIVANIKVLSELDGKCKLSFDEATGQIVQDTSYRMTRAIRRPVLGSMGLTNYNDDLQSLEKFIKFTNKFFAQVAVRPELAADLKTNLEKAKVGLQQLKDQQYQAKPDRSAIIDRVITIIGGKENESDEDVANSGIEEYIEANSHAKFTHATTYLNDNIENMKGEDSSLIHDALFQEINGPLGNYKEVLASKEFQPIFARENNNSNPLTITDFNKLVRHLKFIDKNSNQNYLLRAFLAEFLLLPANKKAEFQKLLEDLGTISKKSLKVNLKQKNMLEIVKESNLFPLSFKMKDKKQTDKIAKLQKLRKEKELAEKRVKNVRQGVAAAGAGALLYGVGTVYQSNAVIGLAQKCFDYGMDRMDDFLDVHQNRLEGIHEGLAEQIKVGIKKNPNHLIGELKALVQEKQLEIEQAGKGLQGNVQELQQNLNEGLALVKGLYEQLAQMTATTSLLPSLKPRLTLEAEESSVASQLSLPSTEHSSDAMNVSVQDLTDSSLENSDLK